MFGDYIYFCVVNIFWFFFPFLFQSLILFLYFTSQVFLYHPLTEWVDFQSSEVSLGCRRVAECPWQARDPQQNRRYSFFWRQQQPTVFAKAS